MCVLRLREKFFRDTRIEFMAANTGARISTIRGHLAALWFNCIELRRDTLAASEVELYAGWPQGTVGLPELMVRAQLAEEIDGQFKLLGVADLIQEDILNEGLKKSNAGQAQSGFAAQFPAIAETVRQRQKNLERFTPREDLLDEMTGEILPRIRRDVQDGWISLYGDAGWVKHELKNAVLWCRANPHKAPRSAWTKFMNAWLSRGWERHRKTLPSASLGVNVKPLDLEAL